MAESACLPTYLLALTHLLTYLLPYSPTYLLTYLLAYSGFGRVFGGASDGAGSIGDRLFGETEQAEAMSGPAISHSGHAVEPSVLQGCRAAEL